MRTPLDIVNMLRVLTKILYLADKSITMPSQEEATGEGNVDHDNLSSSGQGTDDSQTGGES